MEYDILKRVREWTKGQIKYYICFCKVALFLTAAVYCHNFVNYNAMGVLVTYFTHTLKKDTIRRSALLVNVGKGLQTVAESLGYAWRSDFRKTIIIFSTAAYILGLVMLYLSATNRIPNTNFGQFVVVQIAVVLIAVGKGGGVPFLKTYLLDEFIAGHENISDIDYNRAKKRTYAWLCLAGVLLMFFTPLDFTNKPWPRIFLHSMGMIGAASFFSLCGSWFSHQKHPSTKTKSAKRHRTYPDTPDEYAQKNDQPFKNDGNQLPESSTTSTAEAQQKSSLCSLQRVNVTKLLVRMIPMWSAFIVPGLVLSTANTFFSMQDDKMHAQVTTSTFLLAKDVLKEVVALLCEFLVSSRISRSQQNLALKMRIFLGMIFCVLCPSVAWQVEVQRLKDTKVVMSDLWLAPQFCLWGLMEGLAISGLDEFFNYHVSKSMEDYGSEVFNQIPIGIGSLLSVVFVSPCKGWFGRTLNESRLDNYLWMITVVAWINLCWFFFVSTFYSTKEEVTDEGIKLEARQEFWLSPTDIYREEEATDEGIKLEETIIVARQEFWLNHYSSTKRILASTYNSNV